MANLKELKIVLKDCVKDAKECSRDEGPMSNDFDRGQDLPLEDETANEHNFADSEEIAAPSDFNSCDGSSEKRLKEKAELSNEISDKKDGQLLKKSRDDHAIRGTKETFDEISDYEKIRTKNILDRKRMIEERMQAADALKAKQRSKQKVLDCFECGYQTSNKLKLTEHIKRVHTSDKSYSTQVESNETYKSSDGRLILLDHVSLYSKK